MLISNKKDQTIDNRHEITHTGLLLSYELIKQAKLEKMSKNRDFLWSGRLPGEGVS